MEFKFVAIRIAILLPGLCALISAPLTAERKQFSDTTDIVVVEVPITVTLGSEPVRGLTADNFEIRIDGETQEVRSLEMIDLFPPTAGPIDEVVRPPISARRHFLLLFDLSNSAPNSIVRARKAARGLMDTLHPSDLVGVGRYDYINGYRFLLGFTSDRRQVDLALESLGVPSLFNPARDPLQLFLGERRGEPSSTSLPGRTAGRAADFAQEADELIRQLVIETSTAEVNDRMERMAGSFESISQSLASIQGQAYVVYLSEGFDSPLLLGSGLDSAQTRSDVERGQIWKVQSQVRYGNTKVLNAFEGMIESLRRAGAIVQSVDIGGLRDAEKLKRRTSGSDTLNAMAQDTGGELYDNFNDLGEAMELMLDATSVTYLATLQPQDLPMDGEYRKLKVRLEGGPRGAKVSHRDGFFAPRPYQQADAVEKQLASAQLILSDEDSGSLEFDIFTATVPVAGEKAYVPLFFELDGARLLAAAGREPHLGLQLFTYAFGEDGQIHDFYTEQVGLDLSRVGDALKNGGLKYYSHLDLEPGHYRVRVLVRELGSGEFAVRSADVTVDPGGTTLLPVMVADAPGAWVMGRESAPRRRDVPFPFLAGGKPFFPRATPTLPRSGKTDVIVQAYGLGGFGGSELQARIVDLDGQPVGGEPRLELGALETVGHTSGAAPGNAAVARGTLETEDLRRGVYELVLTAPGDAESRVRVEVE